MTARFRPKAKNFDLNKSFIPTRDAFLYIYLKIWKAGFITIPPSYPSKYLKSDEFNSSNRAKKLYAKTNRDVLHWP